jgi:hypothetical protein
MSTDVMSTDAERDPADNGHQRAAEQIDQICHHLLEMFAAVCAAPDDPALAAEANATLRELENLLAAGGA